MTKSGRTGSHCSTSNQPMVTKALRTAYTLPLSTTVRLTGNQYLVQMGDKRQQELSSSDGTFDAKKYFCDTFISAHTGMNVGV